MPSGPARPVGLPEDDRRDERGWGGNGIGVIGPVRLNSSKIRPPATERPAYRWRVPEHQLVAIATGRRDRIRTRGSRCPSDLRGQAARSLRRRTVGGDTSGLLSACGCAEPHALAGLAMPGDLGAPSAVTSRPGRRARFGAPLTIRQPPSPGCRRSRRLRERLTQERRRALIAEWLADVRKRTDLVELSVVEARIGIAFG